jgi:hypothetical protein
MAAVHRNDRCFLSRFTTKYSWAHLDIAGAWEIGQEKPPADLFPSPHFLMGLCQSGAKGMTRIDFYFNSPDRLGCAQPLPESLSVGRTALFIITRPQLVADAGTLAAGAHSFPTAAESSIASQTPI